MSCLTTSAPFTERFWASSLTVIESGIWIVFATNSVGRTNSCFSTLDKKLSPSSSLCSFLESSFLTGLIVLFSAEKPFFNSGLTKGVSPVLAFRLVTRVFCSMAFFLCSSSAFLFASPACRFLSISSKLIVEDVFFVSLVLVALESREIVFRVIETVPAESCSFFAAVFLREIVLVVLVCCSLRNSNNVFLSWSVTSSLTEVCESPASFI